MKSLILLVALAAPLAAHPDPAHTLAEIEEHLAAHPDDPNLLLQKSRLFLRTGHPDTALPIARKALALSPENPELHLLHTLISEALGDPADALARSLEITRRFPDFPEAWSALARLLHQSGKPDEAIAAKLRHLEFRDHLGPGDFLTASAWLRDRHRPETAIEILDRAIETFGPLTGLQQSAIWIECSLSRHEAALQRVRVLVAKHRPSVHLALLRASILECANRHAEAATACDAALALLGPDDPSTFQKITTRKATNLGKAAASTP